MGVNGMNGSEPAPALDWPGLGYVKDLRGVGRRSCDEVEGRTLCGCVEEMVAGVKDRVITEGTESE